MAKIKVLKDKEGGKIYPITSETAVLDTDGVSIGSKVALKVDKVDGKGLSANDYTDAEKAKLSGIEDGADKTTVVQTLTEGTEIGSVGGVALYAPEGGSGAVDDVTVDGTSVVSDGVAVIDLSGKADASELGELSLKIAEKADKISVVDETETTVASLTPNVLHKWGEVAELTITALATPDDETIVNEYLIEFVSGETATTLSLPDSITWMWGSAPTISASKTYQISIVDNLAVIGEF